MQPQQLSMLPGTLRILPFGRNVWHCDEGTRTYRITLKQDVYGCSCNQPNCRHVQQLIELYKLQTKYQKGELN